MHEAAVRVCVVSRTLAGVLRSCRFVFHAPSSSSSCRLQRSSQQYQKTRLYQETPCIRAAHCGSQSSHLVRSPMAAITSSGNRRSSSALRAAAVSTLDRLCFDAAFALSRSGRSRHQANTNRLTDTAGVGISQWWANERTGSAEPLPPFAAGALWSFPGGGRRWKVLTRRSSATPI